MSNKRNRIKAPGRATVSLNQKRQIFADSRLHRGADSDRVAIDEQLEDLAPRRFCAYCGRETRVPDYEAGDWVAPMAYPHSAQRWPSSYLKSHPWLIPLCVHTLLTQVRLAKSREIP